MKRDLARLLRPCSIAVVGGGAWCASIISAAEKIGYEGHILPVHPSGKTISGVPAVKNLNDWPGVIDAAFVGVNRHATIETLKNLNQLKAGGAVCFASGFSEALNEDENGSNLQQQLVDAAGDMPILGPNCYGFINALDRVAIWPDQHGMEPIERGVAILTQSSNIAINLTMQQRALPIAFMVACGNMAQTSQAQIAEALLQDDRVTAIGLHVEGFGDLRQWEALAHSAHRRNVPLVVIKTGASEQAQMAAVSHTASLAGSDAGAQALLDRLGIARVFGLAAFVETLKLLHCSGPLPSGNIASISCSGGEASLVADLAQARGLVFPALNGYQESQLKHALGPMVSLANPLDYHTYIWRDAAAMSETWAAMTGVDISMTLSIVDYPTTDASDWACATKAAIAAKTQTGAPFAVVSTLPELMPPGIARHLIDNSVIPFAGLDEGLAAIEAASKIAPPNSEPVLMPGNFVAGHVLNEANAKAELARFGLKVPASRLASSAEEAGQLAEDLTGPLVLKGLGLAHKSDHGAVRVGLNAHQVSQTAKEIGTEQFLIEEMITGGVVELLIGVVHDPAHGFVLTLGAGGILTELMMDSVSLLVPSDRAQVKQALTRLRCYKVLSGYRGKPGADIDAVLDAIDAVQDYVVANSDRVGEVEINPLICTADGAVAVDALIRKVTE